MDGSGQRRRERGAKGGREKKEVSDRTTLKRYSGSGAKMVEEEGS